MNVTRACSIPRTATIAICAVFLLSPLMLPAQDAGPKPRLELADSVRVRKVEARPSPAQTAIRDDSTMPGVASSNRRGEAPASRSAAATPVAPTIGEVRVDFVRNQSALGVMLYAPAFATTVANDPLAWAASYLLMAGGSFVAASEISRRITVTDPMHRLATGAPIRGAIAGSLLAALLDGDPKSTAGAILAGSIGGTAAALWRGRSMDDGEAAATLLGSDVVGLAAYGLSTGAGLRDNGRADPTRLAITLGGMLAGAPLGQAYAALAPYNVTVGDLRAMSAAGGVGMLAGLTAIANGAHTEREVAAALTLGGLAGLVVGDRLLTRRYDHTPNDAHMMMAGGVAGGLMGAGVALLSGGSRDRWTAFSAGFTTAGAAAGVAWAQYYMRPKPDGVSRLAALTLNPVGVAAMASGMHGSYTIGTIRF